MRKDKQWLKEKLNTEKYYRETSELKAKTTFGELYDRGVRDGINAALEFVNQLDEPEVTLDKAFEKVAESYLMTKEEIWRHLERLETHGGKVTYDEPEVLSQEWIGEHTWNNHYIGRPFVYVDDLQNLIVPKQDKPVIPQFVADYIEECKHIGLTMNEWLNFDSDYDNEDKTEKWLYHNDDETKRHREFTFIDAIRYGYEVEKEKLYYIVDKANNLTLMTFELSDVFGEEIIELVAGYSENETIHFDSKEKAELIAHFIGNSLEVEEVTE